MVTLIPILRGIHLDHARTAFPADQHVTGDSINAAFKALVSDISGLVEILPTQSSVAAQAILERTFVNLAIAIRKPYVDALATVNGELARLSLTHTVDSLTLSMTHLNELSKLKDDMVAEHKSELSNNTQLHHTELAKVNMELSKINAAHVAEMSRINTLHAAQLAELHKSHASTVNNKDYRYDQLKTTNIGLMLKQGPADEISVPESVNRAQTWRKVVDKNPGLQDLEFFTLPVRAHIRHDGIMDLQAREFTTEAEMYAPVLTVLKRHLSMASTLNAKTGDIDHRGCAVFDTHPRKNLSGRSPDMTISIASAHYTDTTSMIGVFELKDGPLDDDAHGQVYDYIKLIKHKQLERTHFVGILSNVRENIVMTVTREGSEGRFRCRTYKTMPLGYILSYLREIILNHHEYLPPRPKFSIGLGAMERRLGNPVFSVVAAFTVPRGYNHRSFKQGKWMNPETAEIGGVMVVKRSVPATRKHQARLVGDEINILRLIDQLGGHSNLPKILYNCLDMHEFAITPFGTPLKPGSIPVADWHPALNDILNALNWLHDNHIIHRDVRWDNIIWDGNHAIFIDLGASVHLTRPQMSVKSYKGGNICCPPRLIGNFSKEYTPLPADDCHAFVLLVSILLFPQRWTNVNSPDAGTSGSMVATMLGAYWTEMGKSKVWGPYVHAAQNADYDSLREMLECLVYYGSPEIERKKLVSLASFLRDSRE